MAHARSNVDFNHFQALNMVLENRSSPPPEPFTGQVYFDTSLRVARVWDGFVGVWIDLNNPAVPPAAPLFEKGTYTCPSSLTLLEVVYLSAADTVDRADANNATAVPAIGFAREKLSATQAVVQYNGELDGFVGLVTGDTYYLSEIAGQVTNVAPTDTGAIVQEVGFARNPTTMVIKIDRDWIQL